MSACAATVPPTALSGQAAATAPEHSRTDLRLHAGFLSDQLGLASDQRNGWGPVERDHANGTPAAGDGLPLSLGGIAFKKGLGVHAPSHLSFPLHGPCTRFQALIGVDDSVRSSAGFGAYRLSSVVFQVFADNTLLFESGVVTSKTPPQPLDLQIPASAQSLRLVVNDGNDGSLLDAADWADAQIECAEVATQAPRTGGGAGRTAHTYDASSITALGWAQPRDGRSSVAAMAAGRMPTQLKQVSQ